MKQKESLKEFIFFAKGMHCSSCELLIEKELLENKQIESVEASAASGRVVVYYQGERPSLKALNRKLATAGYTFSEKPESPKRESTFSLVQTLVIILLLIGGFIILNRSGIASRVVVNAYSPLPAFFLFGLIAGFSSCAALVGGLILSMSKQWSEIYQDQASGWQKAQPFLLFNLGRLVSFALLGAVLGAISAWIQPSLIVSSILAMVVSLIMVLLALQMLGVKALRKFQISTPKFIGRFVADETNFKGRYMPLALGALTFFLPCGFTITAQGLALTGGSGLRGLLVMFFFALGTLPMLLLIGFSSLRLTSKPHLAGRFIKIAGFLVLFFGLYNFNAQLNVLGLASLDDLNLNPAQQQIATNELAPVVKGKQLLKMGAFAYGYEPNQFKVRVGIPVRWEIENKGVSGCTNAIVSQGLFEGQINLDQETNIKEFTPTRVGNYKFSCWMGMVSGVIQVIDQGSSAESAAVPDQEISSGAAGCGGGGQSCGCGCGEN